MIERLLENWLDSASERSYQQVFVQMLVARGYKVLHSTRHCTLEFGKDILAIAPDGTGCAFQLKGDPRGQMTIGEFRSGIQQQLMQLMAQSPSFPGFPKGPHRSYLVSNGSFSEEVQVAASQMNAEGLYPSKVELWPRGVLLDMALAASGSLWPSEIDDSRRLLDLYMADPGDQLPLQVLNDLLVSILRLDEPERERAKAEFDRSATSAAWATGIALAPFARAENHQAIAYGWMLCRSALQSASISFEHQKSKRLRELLVMTERAALDALAALWEEVSNSNHLSMPSALEDVEVYWWRVTTLHGLLATLCLADVSNACLSPEARDGLRKWLLSTAPRPFVWGEGAAGQIMSLALAVGSLVDPEKMGDVIRDLAREIVDRNQPDSSAPLATPYYLGQDVLEIELGLTSQEHSESFAGASFMALPLLACLVALGRKQDCKDLWVGVSKLTHRFFECPTPGDYLRLKALKGRESSKLFSESSTWDELVSSTVVTWESPIADLWLQCLWWQVAPQRTDFSSTLSAVRSIMGNHKDSTKFDRLTPV